MAAGLRTTNSRQTKSGARGARVAACTSVARANRVRCAAVADAEDRLTGSASAAAERKFNFSAGPAMLPLDVLEEVQRDLVSYKGSGTSVLEMSHRSKEFVGIADEAEASLRELLGVPEGYQVLFMQGGASTQFSAVPLNLTAGADDVADYVTTGSWSKKAIKEGKRYCDARLAASSEEAKFTMVPAEGTWSVSNDAKYLHICANETIQGVEFRGAPSSHNGPLVADMSSNFCSKPVNVEDYGVIYAGAQKNIGPAGVTIVIVRDDLIGNARTECPTMLDWSVAAEAKSMYNTPPCFAIYVCGLVFKRLLQRGGLEVQEKLNKEKCGKLYDAIATSGGFYASPVEESVRSAMNVPFTLADADLDKAFLEGAAARGLITLKGHRSVGGMRASIYNAMPMEGVDALVSFMAEFRAQHA